MELLKVANITKVYEKSKRSKLALNDVSFSIKKGEFVALVGPSGSGKSTLFHIIAGLETPSSGTVTIDQTNLTSLSQDQLTIFRRRQIGMIYQFYNLIPTLTVKDNLLLPLMLDQKEIDQSYLNQIISTLHIESYLHEYPNSLSGGQQQRVAIARALIHHPTLLLAALIHHPTLLLADEPTGNLDSQNSREIMDLFRLSNKRTNMTILLITHDMNLAMQADRIIQIKQGELVEEESF